MIAMRVIVFFVSVPLNDGSRFRVRSWRRDGGERVPEGATVEGVWVDGGFVEIAPSDPTAILSDLGSSCEFRTLRLDEYTEHLREGDRWVNDVDAAGVRELEAAAWAATNKRPQSMQEIAAGVMSIGLR